MNPAMKKIRTVSICVLLTVSVSAGLTACSPEVGSKEWCEKLKEKPKGDWTANEAGDFAKHCIM
jgi:hypothetical protein